MAYFPFMIQLDDKQCLIVGGGAVAARKAAQMCEFGACVTVVAPEICAELLAIADTERIDETAGIVENIDGNCHKNAGTNPGVEAGSHRGRHFRHGRCNHGDR